MNKISLLQFIKILVIETNSTTTIRLQHKAQHLSQLKPLEAAFKNLHSYTCPHLKLYYEHEKRVKLTVGEMNLNQQD